MFAPFGLQESDVSYRCLDLGPIEARAQGSEIEDESGHTDTGRPEATPLKRAETSIGTSVPSTLRSLGLAALRNAALAPASVRERRNAEKQLNFALR